MTTYPGYRHRRIGRQPKTVIGIYPTVGLPGAEASRTILLTASTFSGAVSVASIVVGRSVVKLYQWRR